MLSNDSVGATGEFVGEIFRLKVYGEDDDVAEQK